MRALITFLLPPAVGSPLSAQFLSVSPNIGLHPSATMTQSETGVVIDPMDKKGQR